MADTTVQSIVEEWLLAHGYDGLCTDDCGCLVTEGLFPCGCDGANCVPGYRVPDPDDEGGFIVCASAGWKAVSDE